MLQNRHFKTIYIRSSDHSFRQCIPVSYGSREKAIHVIVWTSGHLSKRQRVLVSESVGFLMVSIDRSVYYVLYFSCYFFFDKAIKRFPHDFEKWGRCSFAFCFISHWGTNKCTSVVVVRLIKRATRNGSPPNKLDDIYALFDKPIRLRAYVHAVRKTNQNSCLCSLMCGFRFLAVFISRTYGSRSNLPNVSRQNPAFKLFANAYQR